ncbi:MAG: hypothetical protein KIT57_09970 [Blastocatellales bacterium]|nr:hypothetical protein [Blastocatellales bacterium]
MRRRSGAVYRSADRPRARRRTGVSGAVRHGRQIPQRSCGRAVERGGTNLEALYAGPQGVFVGLDQINALLPRSLAGRGRCRSLLQQTAGRRISSKSAFVDLNNIDSRLRREER